MAVLKATRREESGTHKARALRKKGRIPGVIYGHGLEVQAITLDRHDIEVAILHGERLLEIDLDGKHENALIKELQYDPFGQEILHIDLARVDLDETVRVTVPIVLRGTPAGAAEGGVLHQVAASAEIECLVRSIPEDIRVSVNEMQIGQSLQMRDLPLPEGAKLLEDAQAIVCAVSMVAEEVVAEEAEAAAEPEVIGEKKEEQAEGAEEEEK